MPLSTAISDQFALWLRADAGALTTADAPAGNGDSVLKWIDQSVNGFEFPAGGTAPTLQATAGPGGTPVLRFTTAASMSKSWEAALNTPNLELWIVAKATGGGTNSNIIDNRDAVSATKTGWALEKGAGTGYRWRAFRVGPTNVEIQIYTTDARHDDFFVNSAQVNGSTIRQFFNNTDVQSATTLTNGQQVNPASPGIAMELGNGRVTGAAFDVAEIILVPSIISNADRQAIVAYLADKYYGNPGAVGEASDLVSAEAVAPRLVKLTFERPNGVDGDWTGYVFIDSDIVADISFDVISPDGAGTVARTVSVLEVYEYAVVGNNLEITLLVDGFICGADTLTIAGEIPARFAIDQDGNYSTTVAADTAVAMNDETYKYAQYGKPAARIQMVRCPIDGYLLRDDYFHGGSLTLWIDAHHWSGIKSIAYEISDGTDTLSESVSLTKALWDDLPQAIKDAMLAEQRPGAERPEDAWLYRADVDITSLDAGAITLNIVVTPVVGEAADVRDTDGEIAEWTLYNNYNNGIAAKVVRHLDPVGGSDSNDGTTEGQAWQTFTKARNDTRTIPVCEVLVYDGTLTVSATGDGNARSGACVRFRAAETAGGPEFRFFGKSQSTTKATFVDCSVHLLNNGAANFGNGRFNMLRGQRLEDRVSTDDGRIDEAGAALLGAAYTTADNTVTTAAFEVDITGQTLFLIPDQEETGVLATVASMIGAGPGSYTGAVLEEIGGNPVFDADKTVNSSPFFAATNTGTLMQSQFCHFRNVNMTAIFVDGQENVGNWCYNPVGDFTDLTPILLCSHNRQVDAGILHPDFMQNKSVSISDHNFIAHNVVGMDLNVQLFWMRNLTTSAAFVNVIAIKGGEALHNSAIGDSSVVRNYPNILFVNLTMIGQPFTLNTAVEQGSILWHNSVVQRLNISTAIDPRQMGALCDGVLATGGMASYLSSDVAGTGTIEFVNGNTEIFDEDAADYTPARGMQLGTYRSGALLHPYGINGGRRRIGFARYGAMDSLPAFTSDRTADDEATISFDVEWDQTASGTITIDETKIHARVNGGYQITATSASYDAGRVTATFPAASFASANTITLDLDDEWVTDDDYQWGEAFTGLAVTNEIEGEEPEPDSPTTTCSSYTPGTPVSSGGLGAAWSDTEGILDPENTTPATASVGAEGDQGTEHLEIEIVFPEGTVFAPGTYYTRVCIDAQRQNSDGIGGINLLRFASDAGDGEDAIAAPWNPNHAAREVRDFLVSVTHTVLNGANLKIQIAGGLLTADVGAATFKIFVVTLPERIGSCGGFIVPRGRVRLRRRPGPDPVFKKRNALS